MTHEIDALEFEYSPDGLGWFRYSVTGTVSAYDTHYEFDIKSIIDPSDSVIDLKDQTNSNLIMAAQDAMIGEVNYIEDWRNQDRDLDYASGEE